MVFDGYWVAGLCGLVKDGFVYHLGMCTELGSEGLLSLEFELFLLVLSDLLQSGDGLLYLGAHLLSPLLKGGTVH